MTLAIDCFGMRLSLCGCLTSTLVCVGCSLDPIPVDPWGSWVGYGDGGSMRGDGGTQVTESSVDADNADAYAACPDVFSDPVPNRDDSGGLGLAALRQRVLESRNAFAQWSAQHQDTYHYIRQFDSFTGDFCETTVQVASGTVTAKSDVDYTEGHYSYSNSLDASGWCYPAVTMDALYDECLSTVLCQDPHDNWIYVAIDARGLLLECGFVPMNCYDDCYQGIGPLILTADGTDWTQPLPGCCPRESKCLAAPVIALLLGVPG